MMGKKVLIQFILSSLTGLIAFMALSLGARFFGPEVLGQVSFYLGLIGLCFALSGFCFVLTKNPLEQAIFNFTQWAFIVSLMRENKRRLYF